MMMTLPSAAEWNHRLRMFSSSENCQLANVRISMAKWWSPRLAIQTATLPFNNFYRTTTTTVMMMMRMTVAQPICSPVASRLSPRRSIALVICKV